MLLTDASPTEYWGSEAVKVSSALKKGRSVFITGPAGTGKSALTREIKKNLGDSAVLTSTTGISAMNIGGSTIHSFSGIGIHSDPRAVEAVVNTMHWPHVRKKIRETQVVMIDEISMLRKDTLNLIERVFQKLWETLTVLVVSRCCFAGTFFNFHRSLSTMILIQTTGASIVQAGWMLSRIQFNLGKFTGKQTYHF